ncbi:MAG TPA: hypothetical protein VHN16_08555, partial [Streptosporangiaceae bacterium]|nr:hypothetical protein [Streptosporangiaceae bacterium]
RNNLPNGQWCERPVYRFARLAADLAADFSVLAAAVVSEPSGVSRWARTNQWNSSSWCACPMSMSWVTWSSSSVVSMASRWASMSPA